MSPSLTPVELRKIALGEAVTRYAQYLEMAGEFLHGRYGISKETAEDLRFGVCEDPFPAHKGMQGRLVIPYLDAYGGVYALKFRCIQHTSCKENGCVKYLAEPGHDGEPSLYNVQALLRDDETLWVTEGEMDAAVLWGELGVCAVGYPGASNWRGHFNRAIGPDWPRVVVVGDGDDAGRTAAKRVAKELRADTLMMPDGEDVSSYYKKHGADATRTLLGLDVLETEFPF